jgi:hypothetical protein
MTAAEATITLVPKLRSCRDRRFFSFPTASLHSTFRLETNQNPDPVLLGYLGVARGLKADVSETLNKLFCQDKGLPIAPKASWGDWLAFPVARRITVVAGQRIGVRLLESLPDSLPRKTMRRERQERCKPAG